MTTPNRLMCFAVLCPCLFSSCVAYAQDASVDEIIRHQRENAELEATLAHVATTSKITVNGKQLKARSSDTFRGKGKYLIATNSALQKTVYNNGLQFSVSKENPASGYVLLSLLKNVSEQEFSESEMAKRKLFYPISQFSTGVSLNQILTSSDFKSHRGKLRQC